MNHEKQVQQQGTLARKAAYTLAAGAAASAGSAEAQVIYSGIQDLAIGQGLSQNLNLDGDAYADVLLTNYVFAGGNYQGATVNFFPGQLVGFYGGPSGLAYVSALSEGATIDASTVGPTFFGSLAYGTSNPNAEFNDADGAFLGLSFPINGNAVFGWVRVTIDNAAGTFVINDWAYNATPGEGILAGEGIVPEPGALGLLAAGAAGVAALRSRRRED